MLAKHALATARGEPLSSVTASVGLLDAVGKMSGAEAVPDDVTVQPGD